MAMAKMRMVRQMFNKTITDKIRNEKLREELQNYAGKVAIKKIVKGKISR